MVGCRVDFVYREAKAGYLQASQIYRGRIIERNFAHWLEARADAIAKASEFYESVDARLVQRELFGSLVDADAATSRPEVG